MALARLTLREVWISYRLLVFVALLGGAGLVVPLVALWAPRFLERGGAAPPPSTTVALTWYGYSIAVAAVLLAASAARTLARDRLRGTAAWVLAAPVPRGAFYLGWLVAFATVAVVGMVISGVTAWLTLGSFGGAPDPVMFAAASLAALAFLLVATALGLICGALLPRTPAALVAAVLTALLAAAPLLVPQAARWLPSGGIVRMASLATGVEGLGGSLQALGAAMAAVALLAAIGATIVERSDL